MAEYVLQQTPSETAAYLVHEQNCAKLAGLDELRYIGSYGNPQAAFDKAVGWYAGVGCCPDCLPG